MVKKFIETLSIVQTLQDKSLKAHSYLIDILEQSMTEQSSQSHKVLIDLSLLEEIGTLLTTLSKNDNKISRGLNNLRQNLLSLKSLISPVQLLKQDLEDIKISVKSSSCELGKHFKQVSSIQKEFKTRCQAAFIDYLKGIDIDLRKILKPLVPSSVVQDQVKYPTITVHSSLHSSIHSLSELAELAQLADPKAHVQGEEDLQLASQPEPSEDTIQKLNTHIQMLVNTLETVAKDLIQILTEANREYYQQVNLLEAFSRPPTPLAAPLPDYFCYEVQDTPREITVKQVLSSQTKELWLKRLKKLNKDRNIPEDLYKSLVFKLKTKEKKLDLQELFYNEQVSISERENLVYYLINGSTEFDKHVSLSEIMNDKKFKPEPPKQPKPKTKFLNKPEKDADKRLSPDMEVAKIWKAFPHQPRIAHSIRLISKSPKLDRLLKSRKSVRVRSTTPNEKEKIGKKTPTMQKMSLGTFYAKHRLRKNM